MRISATENSFNTPVYERIVSLGFPAMTGVRTLLSIAHLFGSSEMRCGIYCLAFSADIFYIGQAVDVVRRFSQHRRNYDDIVGFSFTPAPKALLNEIEQNLIYRAETIGIKLKNAVHVSIIFGDTDFDLVVPILEQEAWLSAVPRIAAEPDECLPKIILPVSQRVRFSKNFEQFTKHPLFGSAILLLQQYISKCLPAPRLTEYSFWSVSCMPSTNKNTWPRLFCVNAASMELFVVGWEKSSNLLWSILTVDEDVLMKHWPNPDEFLEKFPFVEFLAAGYRDAGQNQITLRCNSDARMDQLLSDVGVCKAAATLNLRVMRKRANLYMQYHCVQLANRAFSIQS